MIILDDISLISRMSYRPIGFSGYIKFMCISTRTFRCYDMYKLEIVSSLFDTRLDLVAALSDSRWK